jgi:hypothetical protein
MSSAKEVVKNRHLLEGWQIYLGTGIGTFQFALASGVFRGAASSCIT